MSGDLTCPWVWTMILREKRISGKPFSKIFWISSRISKVPEHSIRAQPYYSYSTTERRYRCFFCQSFPILKFKIGFLEAFSEFSRIFENILEFSGTLFQNISSVPESVWKCLRTFHDHSANVPRPFCECSQHLPNPCRKPNLIRNDRKNFYNALLKPY